jgi:sarcosine oxidase
MWDAVVLGLGGVGSFALRALARRGVKVLGLEQFEPGHDQGSSHGRSRVYRHAYFEHADYVPLLKHASSEFLALERDTGSVLADNCGTLLIGREDCAVLGASEAAAGRHAIEVEPLERDALRARYPLFAVPEGWRGLFEPGGGFVRPEASVRAAVAHAAELGADVRAGTRVRWIREADDGVVLGLDNELVRARRLLVCAGAWTAQLLPQLAGELRVTRQVQGWVTPRDAAVVQPSRFPTWLIVRADGVPVYGIPADPLDANGGLPKVALHGNRELVEPDKPRRPIDDFDRANLMRVVREWLPALGDELAEVQICMYTVTRDEHFVVDRVPRTNHVWCAAGLSGHGFKLTPALGEALVGLALDGASELPIEFLSAARFAQ